jgi:hypothetical protein
MPLGALAVCSSAFPAPFGEAPSSSGGFTDSRRSFAGSFRRAPLAIQGLHRLAPELRWLVQESPLAIQGLHRLAPELRWLVQESPLAIRGIHRLAPELRWLALEPPGTTRESPLAIRGLHRLTPELRWLTPELPGLVRESPLVARGQRRSALRTATIGEIKPGVPCLLCREAVHDCATMTRQDYYPVSIPAQVLWLRHFADTLPQYIGALAIDETRLRDGIADALWLAYVIGPWRTELRRIAPAGTAAIEHAQTGKGDHAAMQLPLYQLPPLPEGVVPRPAGALKRLFKLVRTIKFAKGYTDGIGQLLGILPKQDTSEHATPTFKIKVLPASPNQKVAIRSSKHGHDGVFIETRRGGGDWEKLAISMKHLHEDKRPLLVPGQPELREYRLRFWDNGKPNGDWTDVATVTVGV